MPRAILLVQSAPSSPDREDEYNDWYDNIHLDEVCSIPGFVGARRYQLSETNIVAPHGVPPHLAIYEIESDDLAATLNELVVRGGGGQLNMSDALGMDPPPTTVLYELRG